jgi:hypothetical protein
MGQRLELHALLMEIAPNVYFQAPTNTQMQYPCIKYERDGDSSQHADNEPYRHTKRYQVTVIDRNPDSVLPDLVEELPMCRFDRYFAAEDLNHYIFNLFF